MCVSSNSFKLLLLNLAAPVFHVSIHQLSLTLFQTSAEVQKSKVAQCNWGNGWKPKCTGSLLPLLLRVNDRCSARLSNFTEERKHRQEWDVISRMSRGYMSALFCVTGTRHRHRRLGWRFPCHGWLCRCDESFVWVRRAGLCHIHCRSLWINLVGFAFTTWFYSGNGVFTRY